MMLLLCGAAFAVPVEIVVRQRSNGDPVAAATIEVGELTVVTDVRGRAVLDVPADAPLELNIVADGLARTVLSVVPPFEAPIRIWLVKGAGVYEVVVEGLKPSADPVRHSVDGELAEETPGTLDDSVRLVQSLPGVTVQREYSPSSGDLSVRGSAPGDSRYYFDGIEIPYLYHFNQYASVFPATQVDKLDLYPSTFSSRYGNAVGAVVEATSKVEPPKAVHGGGHVNFVMVGADVSAPLGKDWWFSASGRRSYQDLGGEQTAQYTVWPTFHDFGLRAEKGDDKRGIGVFAMGAGDSYTRAVGELDVLDPIEAANVPYLAYHQGFQVLGTRVRFDSGDYGGRFVAALVHHRRQSDLSSIGNERLDTYTLSSRSDTELRGTGRLALDAGYELQAGHTRLEVSPAGPDGVRVAEEAPAIARGISLDEGALRAWGGVYSTVHGQLGRVRLMPGLRIGADSYPGAAAIAGLQLEPRMASRISVGDAGMIKLGAGRYTQRPDLEQLFAAPDLATTGSWQLALGWEEALAGRLEIAVETYAKWLQDPVLTPIDSVPYTVDRGRAFGMEWITRYRLRERVFLWGWLAVQRTLVEGPAGDFVPADGDQILSGGLVASIDIGKVNLGGRYRYASGLPFTPLTGSVYDAGNDTWLPTPGLLNSSRLPAYHKVDLRAAYDFVFRGWSMSASLELWLVPKASAQLYPTWNYDYTEQGWVIGPTVLPLLGLRARF